MQMKYVRLYSLLRKSTSFFYKKLLFSCMINRQMHL